MAALGILGAFVALLAFAFRGKDEIGMPAERIAQFDKAHQAEVAL
jgi:cytochrome o ubiquinol oxidase subunit 1